MLHLLGYGLLGALVGKFFYREDWVYTGIGVLGILLVALT